MRDYQKARYKPSDLLALLYTKASIQEIAYTLAVSEAQAQRAACAVYQRAKVTGRIKLMAAELERRGERKDSVT